MCVCVCACVYVYAVHECVHPHQVVLARMHHTSGGRAGLSDFNAAVYRRLSIEVGISEKKLPLVPVYVWVLFFGTSPPVGIVWSRKTINPKFRMLHHVDMHQLVDNMLKYLHDNPMAKIGMMFDDTGNQHCVYLTYNVYKSGE